MDFTTKYYDRPEVWVKSQKAPYNQVRAQKTADLLPTSTRSILDLGCGSGPVTNELARRFPFVVGMDIALQLLKNLKTSGVQGSLDTLPFATNSVDAITAGEVIEHVPLRTRARALSEIKRAARKHVVISVPYRESLEMRQVKCGECGCQFHADWHTSAFDERAIESLLNPEFECVRFELLGRVDKRVPLPFVVLAHAFGGWANVGAGGAVCPQCGNDQTFIAERNLMTRLAWGLPLRYLPLTRYPRWIAALYQRRGEPSP